MGKIVCTVMMFWGNFLISLIIVSLANLVEFDRQEAKSYFQITNELAIMQSFHSASDLIKSFFRYIIIRKRERAKGEETTNRERIESKKALFEIKQRAKQFRQINTDLMMTA
jgi:hypothetical protein